MIWWQLQAVVGDADREAKAWLDRLAEADKIRRGFQEQAAKGLMTLAELANRLEEIEEARETARSELAILKESRQRLEELERDGEASWNVTPAHCQRLSKPLPPRSATESTRYSG